MLMPALTETAIAELSAQERLSLITALWDSLSDEQTPLPVAQRTELERRLAGFEDDRAGAVSWESLKTELRARRYSAATLRFSAPAAFKSA